MNISVVEVFVYSNCRCFTTKEAQTNFSMLAGGVPRRWGGWALGYNSMKFLDFPDLS